MLVWLTETLLGKLILTFCISMVPFAELRVGLPAGIAAGLNWPEAAAAAILGSFFPVPLIIGYIRRIFAWIRRHFSRLDGFVSRLEAKGDSKGEQVRKYGPWALLLLVALPIPGTGAWTASLVAAMLKIRMKKALPAILVGLVLCSIIMIIATYGVRSLILS